MPTQRIRISVSVVLATLFALTSLFADRLDVFASASNFTVQADASESVDLEALRLDVVRQPQRLPILPPEQIDSETLWLARCIYSETKRPQEQALVAWVIRNRVETSFRGQHSYRDVVLDPYQFSAFNRGSAKRKHYSSLTPTSKVPGWQRALSIAHYVRLADSQTRPFPNKTRHFYSERSMRGGKAPAWAKGTAPVDLAKVAQVDERRFRFYNGVF